MLVLILKLVILFVIAIAAIAQWTIDNKWHDRRTVARRRWARVLLCAILLGVLANAITTVVTNEQVRSERAQAEADMIDREERARTERSTISQRISELVQLARERDPGLTEQAALKLVISEIRMLRKRTIDLSSELTGFRRFNNVAHLNAQGLGKLRGGHGIEITTALSKALEEAYLESDDGTVSPRCTDTGIAVFKDVIAMNPDFPFSYWALARCGYEKEEADWMKYGKRAVEILEQTTRIAGHDKGHGQALMGIKRLVAGELYRRGDYEGALSKLQPLAEIGDGHSQYLLGAMYETGVGTQINDIEARRWYQRAAEGGHEEAQAALERLRTSRRR